MIFLAAIWWTIFDASRTIIHNLFLGGTYSFVSHLYSAFLVVRLYYCLVSSALFECQFSRLCKYHLSPFISDSFRCQFDSFHCLILRRFRFSRTRSSESMRKNLNERIVGRGLKTRHVSSQVCFFVHFFLTLTTNDRPPTPNTSGDELFPVVFFFYLLFIYFTNVHLQFDYDNTRRCSNKAGGHYHLAHHSQRRRTAGLET